MKKFLILVVAFCCVTAFVTGATAAEKLYSLKGSVVSVDSSANTVTVKAMEGVTTAANNRWEGDVVFKLVETTKISMGKKNMTLEDLKPGENVKMKFHEENGKPVANKIMVSKKMK